MLLEIPSGIGNLKALECLDIRNCQKLRNIPDTIGSLTALETLRLSGRKMISEIPSMIGRVTSLKSLSPSDDINCIWKIPDTFCCGKQHSSFCGCDRDFTHSITFEVGLEAYLERVPENQALEVLCLQWKCGYRGVPIGFISLSIFPYLRKLSLRNLKIFQIPNDLGCLKALESLDLSGNGFETIPASIKELCRLEELNLSHCQNIQSIPELSPSLKYLYVNCCCCLQSISNISRRSSNWFERWFCFNSVRDFELLPIHGGEVKAWACFSKSELPSCFDYWSRTKKLTVRCPPNCVGFKPVGFVARFVIASGYLSPEIPYLNIHCRWHGEGYQSSNICLDSKKFLSNSYCCERDLLLVFSCNFGEEISCDEISFHFDLNQEIKSCGIDLCQPENCSKCRPSLPWRISGRCGTIVYI